jgi:hypothetical protein
MKVPPALTPRQAIALRMDGIGRRQKQDRATRYMCLRLTLAEAEGLEALAGEGKAGLLTDAEAAKAYIGNGHKQNAANRAYEKLTEATSKARGITMRRQWVWIAFIIGFLAGGETAWQIAANTMKHL